MIKLILNVPIGFNVELFCNIASAMVRDKVENEYERTHGYEYNLGEYISRHYVAGDKVFYFGDNKYIQPMGALIEEAQKPRALYKIYEVNADWIDFGYIEALQKLQEFCPEVEIYFENCGDGENEEPTWLDEDFCTENLDELFKYKEAKYNG